MAMTHYTEFARNPYKMVTKNNVKYINNACSFDIETTSFFENEKKRAVMYIWQFAIDDVAYYGRTWGDFKKFLAVLTKQYQLNANRKMIIYVHNLGYEFQFLCGNFRIEKVFSRTARHPMKFEIENFIFKDSYLLSGLSLEKTLKDCNSKYAKMLGDLDYTKIRHYKTKLTDTEMAYCANDVLGLNEFIKSEIHKNGDNILNIPLTKTGYVRKYVRGKCFKNQTTHREIIRNEFVTEEQLFSLLNNSYSGGYVHANPLKIGDVIKNVASIDFTSSYPTVMISHKYPRGEFKKLHIKNIDVLEKMCNEYACVFSVMFENIEPLNNCHIISDSKCITRGKKIVDNGRIASAETLITNITNVDWLNIKKTYKWEKICVKDFYYCRQDYLPKPLILSVLDLFDDKTKLKNVVGMGQEYLVKKGMLNGIYGMCVTNQFKNEICFDNDNNEWYETKIDLAEKLKTEKEKRNTFLCYQWGVWISAWARYELIDGIINIGDDYIYSDTDSIKFTNYKKHIDYIERYNKYVVGLLEKCLNRYSIPVERINAYSNENEKFTLGLWDFEGVYEKFKTLGCKRYCYTKNGKFDFTVSGLPKKCKYFENLKTDNARFNAFNDNLLIDETMSGKLTSTYINEPFTTKLTDYTGDAQTVSENTYINLSPQPFSLTISDIFIDYLQGCGNPLFKNFNDDLEEKKRFIENEKKLF